MLETRALPVLYPQTERQAKVEYSEEEKWLAMRRGDLEIVVNLRNQPLKRQMPSASKVVLSSNAAIKTDQASLNLPPDSVAILKVE